MKILVIGSCRHLPPVQQGNFKQACEELGEALATKKHTLIVCSGNKFTADPHIVRGANKVSGRHKVLVYRPDRNTIDEDPDEPVDTYEEVNKYPNIEFIRRNFMGGWRVVHIQALYSCHAVVAIGGHAKGTGTVVYSAEVLGKPVVLIPSFAGATQEAWRDFKHYFSEDECQRLEEPWKDKQQWGQRIVEVALAVANKNPFKRIKIEQQILKGVAGLSALAIWFSLFSGGLPWLADWLGLILILASASILGTLLRSVLRDLGLMQSEWHRPSIFLEAPASLIIAFGIFLLSQAGSFLLNGQPLNISELADLQRVGLGLSILCFLAALFLENAWQRLSKEGRRFIGA